MATSGRSASLSSTLTGAKNSVEGSNPEEDDGQNLWSTILSEVSTHSRSKLPSGKNVLVMGEVGSGKTTLVAKLQGIEEYMKGRGLEYLYFSVHDDDVDDHTRCNAWVLDGDLYHKGLQGVAVPVDSIENTLLLIAVDMSRPWNALDSLQKWAAVAREHIDKLRVAPEKLREMERKIVKHFQEYTEPGSGEDGASQRRSEEEEGVLLPLGDNTLTHNLGIPVVVVCTKCDAISTLEKEHDYRDEHLDFIQSHVRRFCLQYGASLLYTSVKEMKNMDILYKYLVHRLYGFPFHCLAQVVEKDAVFIPSGWDNEKKIAILHENLQTLKSDDSYEDVIVKPPVRKIVHEKEIQAEDDQVFLVKLQSLLAKQPAVAAGRPVDTASRAPAGSPRTSNRSAAANVANAMPQSGQTSEGVLANFFNSLLTKKAGPGAPGTPAGGNNTPGTVRKSGSKLGLSDVQAELDRISSRETDADLSNANDAHATDGQET
ncbi:cytoplasmic dynein 1 light intermediate chain 1 [Nothobranchius furzeri]|uniref:Dynein light intermediate chain n=2 Tax=Nothobranchius TaxID=28779 RepID=A0A1A7ZFZ9_NOTFU|nr:cytoplasmic dynein 1 light intermediate chain 1 [Nothobranchius furzeri]KAF7210707.1 cytoplasmic dynein 1 light intermediate chain 1-like [Nothobranchius furzeri]